MDFTTPFQNSIPFVIPRWPRSIRKTKSEPMLSDGMKDKFKCTFFENEGFKHYNIYHSLKA